MRETCHPFCHPSSSSLVTRHGEESLGTASLAPADGSPSRGATFPTALAHILSVCHVLVILALCQASCYCICSRGL